MNKPSERIRNAADKRIATLEGYNEGHSVCHISAIMEYLDDERDRVNGILHKMLVLIPQHSINADLHVKLYGMIDDNLVIGVDIAKTDKSSINQQEQ